MLTTLSTAKDLKFWHGLQSDVGLKGFVSSLEIYSENTVSNPKLLREFWDYLSREYLFSLQPEETVERSLL